MSNSKNTAGKLVFGDAYALPSDLQALADEIWSAYVTRVGTSSARGSIPPGELRDGIVFRETDTGLIWLRWSGAWYVVGGLTPLVVMRRTNVALSANGGAYTDLSATAAWTASTGILRGATYSGGIAVTVPGWYEVFWAVKGSDGTNPGLVGISVNASTGIGAESLHALDHVTSKVIQSGNASGRVKLAAGDVLRLFGYGDGGTMFIRPATVLEPTHWGCRWVAPA